jgi:hypothetical protein
MIRNNATLTTLQCEKSYPVSKWKDYAKENSNTIDIIIFKMVITEGWIFPALVCFFQMRDSQSNAGRASDGSSKTQPQTT